MLFDVIIFIQLSVILFFSLSTYSILYSTLLYNDEDKKSFYLGIAKHNWYNPVDYKTN